MRAEGLRGIPREKFRKTTIGDGAETERPEDLVKRKFAATGPNQLWVADFKCRRRHLKSYADVRTMPMLSVMAFDSLAFGVERSA